MSFQQNGKNIWSFINDCAEYAHQRSSFRTETALVEKTWRHESVMCACTAWPWNTPDATLLSFRFHRMHHISFMIIVIEWFTDSIVGNIIFTRILLWKKTTTWKRKQNAITLDCKLKLRTVSETPESHWRKQDDNQSVLSNSRSSRLDLVVF